MNIDQELSRVAEKHAPRINAALKAAASSNGHKKSGKLIRGMKTKVRKDGDEPWGISTDVKRYGYILHHGVESGAIERGSVSYYSKGIKGSNWIGNGLSKTVPQLGDDLQKISADLTTQSMKLK